MPINSSKFARKLEIINLGTFDPEKSHQGFSILQLEKQCLPFFSAKSGSFFHRPKRQLTLQTNRCCPIPQTFSRHTVSRRYVRCSAACAAASLATGTRGGEQLT